MDKEHENRFILKLYKWLPEAWYKLSVKSLHNNAKSD